MKGSILKLKLHLFLRKPLDVVISGGINILVNAEFPLRHSFITNLGLGNALEYMWYHVVKE